MVLVAGASRRGREPGPGSRPGESGDLSPASIAGEFTGLRVSGARVGAAYGLRYPSAAESIEAVWCDHRESGHAFT